MRKFVFVFLVSSLLVAFAFVQKGNILGVKASSPIYQGDLILGDNDVYVIEGEFNINGSIIVEENATLYLKNAIVNFTQTESRQYSIILQNPLNGYPRLLAYNSTITSAYRTEIILKDNSVAHFNNATIPWYLFAKDYSTLSISNDSYVSLQYGYGSATINVYNSTIGEWHNYNYGGGGLQIKVHDSEISSIVVGPKSINCTIYHLEPGHINYWNFIANCSVTVLSGGAAPNITLINTTVNSWRLAFYGDCEATIIDSIITEASAIGAPTGGGSSLIYLKSTTCKSAYVDSNSVLKTVDLHIITGLRTLGQSNAWLVNSTYNNLNVDNLAQVHICWYLDAHVVDSIGQDVPLANVTATYPNATLAESGLTDASGWVRLPLMEMMVNATGEYPVGNYTIKATYLTYSNSTTVNMTDNQMITVTLSNFIIPEFSPFLILPIFMIATLSAAIVYKRKNTK
jgi:hypothetical protein